ncbi:hypothetical protein DMP42_09670 [Klebsiella pneumoniae]|nr:hypothetical protein DMP42_09670 [Klebsiella pneumoniae]
MFFPYLALSGDREIRFERDVDRQDIGKFPKRIAIFQNEALILNLDHYPRISIAPVRKQPAVEAPIVSIIVEIFFL